MSEKTPRYLRIEINDAPYWEYVTRTNATGGATLVAVTEQNEIVLVSQYRIPLRAHVIELPAGLVGDDDRDESPAQAAARELREETGYAVSADELQLLARGPALAGLTDELTSVYLAQRVRKVGEGGGAPAEGERIETVLLPIATAMDQLAEFERTGYLIDLKVYAGLQLLATAWR